MRRARSHAPNRRDRLAAAATVLRRRVLDALDAADRQGLPPRVAADVLRDLASETEVDGNGIQAAASIFTERTTE